MSKNRYQIPALHKASRILAMLSQKEADLAEVMAELELPKSSAYSLLLTLEEIGFVRRLPKKNKFTLGFRLFELGNLAVAKVSVRDQAMEFLQELSRSEKVTCHLGALDGNEAMYLLKVDPKDSILINSWEGKRLSLTSSAMGKTLLAWLPEDRKRTLLDSASFVAKTSKTIVDKKVFYDHLTVVKKQGWALDDEEDILGIRCIAAPVFSANDEVRYSLSASSTVQGITKERIPSLVNKIEEAARNISQALGASRKNWQR